VGSARGRRSSKRAPRPGRAGSARTSSPPWALASWRAMYSPRPAPPARRVAPRVELGEPLEDALPVGAGHPGAGVLDGQHGHGAEAGRLQPDRAVVGGVLGRVVEQVAQHLEDGLGGGPHGQGLAGDQHQLPPRVGDPGHGQGVAGQRGRVDQGPLDRLAGGLLEPGRQQQLLDQLLEPGALADGHVHELAPLGHVQGGAPAAEGPQGAQDHGERRLQLVGDGGQQVPLEPVALRELADQGLLGRGGPGPLGRGLGPGPCRLGRCQLHLCGAPSAAGAASARSSSPSLARRCTRITNDPLSSGRRVTRRPGRQYTQRKRTIHS
jgi:hypothetical protein